MTFIIALVAAVVLLVAFGGAFKLISEPYDANRASHRTLMLLSVLLCVMIALTFSLFTRTEDGAEDVAYPLQGSVANYSPYYQQFDAWMKGQLHIDYPADPGLAELENPYDRAERDDAEIYYLWDRAYYDGNYYCYFGPAPVVTVYAPYYLLTGSLPGEYFVAFVFVLLTAVFLPLAFFKLAEVSKLKAPVLLCVLSAPAIFLSSLVLLLLRGRTRFYFIAVLAGCAFISLFAYLFFAALASKAGWRRNTLFALSGVAYALAFHSRLNIAFGAAIIILPALWFFIVRREAPSRGHIRSVIGELASLGAPVALGLALAMAHNALRFSGPFDFGTSYQLTVADVSTYKLTLADLPYAIYHYFLEIPKESKVFPYISFNYNKFTTYGHYVYNDAMVGLFSAPMLISVIASPAVIFSGRFTVRRRVMVAASALALIVLALLDFCLGGVIYRYTCDLTFIASLLSAVVLFSIYEQCARLGRLPEVICFVLILALLCVSMSDALRVALINDNGNIYKYATDEGLPARLPELLPYVPKINNP